MLPTPLDKEQAVSMVVATLNTGAVPKVPYSDFGYYSTRVVEEFCALGVEPPRHQAWTGAPGHIPSGLSA